MNANDFKDFIIPYLPISFEQKSRDFFIQYLLEALVLNWENKKYQFSLLSANILFMTIIFRDFWFDDKHARKSIVLNEQLPKSYYLNATDFFNLSPYNEKLFLDSYLKSLQFDNNEIKDIKALIDHRDHCAHASGKIYYDDSKVAGFFEEYKEAIIKIESKREKSTLKQLIELYKGRKSCLKEFIKDLIFVYSISYNECMKLIDCFSGKQEKEVKAAAYDIIFKHFLKSICNSFYFFENLEESFFDDVQGYVNSLDQAKKQYALFESELSFEIQGIEIQSCDFEKIASLFEDIEEKKESRDNARLESILNDIKKNMPDQTVAEKIINDLISFRGTSND